MPVVRSLKIKNNGDGFNRSGISKKTPGEKLLSAPTPRYKVRGRQFRFDRLHHNLKQVLKDDLRIAT